MLTVKVEGLEELKATLRGLSFSDRRFAAAMATALTRTARAVEQQWRQQFPQELDRPSPRTTRGTVVNPANAKNLQAAVAVKGESDKADTTAGWLSPQEYGGSRLVKRFERALWAKGTMPRNMFTVPGDGATLDNYGNVSRSQIIEVLNQLGTDFSVGYAQVIGRTAARRAAAAARVGRKYFAIQDRKHGLPPGIYYRNQNKELKAVFFFVPRLQYPRRLTLIQRGMSVAQRNLNEQVGVAVKEQLRRLR